MSEVVVYYDSEPIYTYIIGNKLPDLQIRFEQVEDDYIATFNGHVIDDLSKFSILVDWD